MRVPDISGELLLLLQIYVVNREWTLQQLIWNQDDTKLISGHSDCWRGWYDWCDTEEILSPFFRVRIGCSLHLKNYHLESRWRNSHVLVYHGPLQIAAFWEWLAIYFHHSAFHNLWNGTPVIHQNLKLESDADQMFKWDEWSDDFSRWETVHTAFLWPLRCFFFFSSMHSDYKDLVDFIKIKLELLSLRDRRKRTCFGQMSTWEASNK